MQGFVQVAVDHRQGLGQALVVKDQLAIAPGQAVVLAVGLIQMRFVITRPVAGLHARAKAVATVAGLAVTADQYRTFHQGHLDLIVILPHVELGAGDPGPAIGRVHHEGMLTVVADLEEGFALDQRDPTLVLVIGETQFGVEVEFDFAAVAEHYAAQMLTAFQVLIAVGQPALLPTDPGASRQGHQGDGCGRGEPLPGAAAALRQGHDVVGEGAGQMVGGLPDVHHRLVFLQVQRMSRQPLLERQPLGGGAVFSLQAQAPLRSGIGDGIMFGGAETGVVH
ncbi:hypothetical protein D3C76_1030990 [compost metagenome]